MDGASDSGGSSGARREPDSGTTPPRRGFSARWLLGLVAVTIVWLLIRRFTELENVARTLERGRWGWLLAAAACQALYFLLYALDYRQAFRSVGVEGRVRDLLPVLLASLAAGEAAPVGWAAGSAVFVRFAVARGSAPERAAVATLLAQAADLITFSATFAVGILFLFWRHDLRPYEIAGAAALLLMNALLGGLLALTLWRPDLPLGLLRRLFGRWPRVAAWSERIAGGLSAATAEVRADPRRPAASLAASLGAQGANVASLFFVFLAFAQPIGIGALVAGYGVGTLAWMVSLVPTGVGLVEGAMALTFASLGVPAGSAAVIAVAYRGLNFWLPLLIGILCLRRVGPVRATEESSD